MLNFNPLVLYGPSGTGKSHLARGMAAAWKARDNVLLTVRARKSPHAEREEYNTRQRVVCTTAVDFARELAEAIDTQAVEEFRAKHREAALLVVEDLGMLATRKAGKLNAQEELIHTLDALLAEDRWVIVTASAPPAELPGILSALKSRLTGGLTIPLRRPDGRPAWRSFSSWRPFASSICRSRSHRPLPRDCPARPRSWPARCSSW